MNGLRFAKYCFCFLSCNDEASSRDCLIRVIRVRALVLLTAFVGQFYIDCMLSLVQGLLEIA